MTDHIGPLRAELVQDTPNVQTRWLVRRYNGWGRPIKAYYVTTYPDTDHMMVETALTGRRIAPLVARKLTPEIRAAIAEVKK